MFTPSTRTRPVTGALTIALYIVRPRRDASGCGLPTCTERTRPTPWSLLRAPDDALGLAGAGGPALEVDDELHAKGARPVVAVQLGADRGRDPRGLALARAAAHRLGAGVVQRRRARRVKRRLVAGDAHDGRVALAGGAVADAHARRHAVRPGR